MAILASDTEYEDLIRQCDPITLLNTAYLFSGYAHLNHESFVIQHKHLENGTPTDDPVPQGVEKLYRFLIRMCKEKSKDYSFVKWSDEHIGEYWRIYHYDLERLLADSEFSLPEQYVAMKQKIIEIDQLRDNDPICDINYDIELFQEDVPDCFLSQTIRGLATACCIVISINPAPQGYESEALVEEAAYQLYKAKNDNLSSPELTWAIPIKRLYLLAYNAGRKGKKNKGFSILNPEDAGDPRKWEIDLIDFLVWCQLSGIHLRQQLLSVIPQGVFPIIINSASKRGAPPKWHELRDYSLKLWQQRGSNSTETDISIAEAGVEAWIMEDKKLPNQSKNMELNDNAKTHAIESVRKAIQALRSKDRRNSLS